MSLLVRSVKVLCIINATYQIVAKIIKKKKKTANENSNAAFRLACHALHCRFDGDICTMYLIFTDSVNLVLSCDFFVLKISSVKMLPFTKILNAL